MGNSHAAHLVQAVIDEYPELNVLQATSTGCTGLLPLSGQKRCIQLFNYLYQQFLPQNNIDTIIFSSRIRLRDLSSFLGTINELEKRARKIIVVGPVPEYKPHLFLTFAKAQHYEMTEDLVEVAALTMDQSRVGIDNQLDGFMHVFSKSTYFSVLKTMCDPKCPIFSSKGEITTFDYGHFTRSTARDVAKQMREHLID